MRSIRNGTAVLWAPAGVKTFNPAFDVTDHKYITAVVTEKGVIRPPYDVSLREIMGRKVIV